MKISIGMINSESVDGIYDLHIDDSFFGTFRYERNSVENQKTLDRFVREMKNSELIRRYVFDTERLKQTASDHYAICDSEIKYEGIIKELDLPDHSEYVLVMKRRGDFETFVHELMHISNRLYREGDPYQRNFFEEDMNEDAIDIASEIVTQRFPKLLDDIRSLQINRVIDLMKREHLNSLEKFFQLEEDYFYIEEDYFYIEEELPPIRKNIYEIILNTYFRDELLSELQNGRPKLPQRQLWLFH